MHVAIYSGAAFTDAGRLFRSLQANASTLRDNGVTLLGPRRSRKVFSPPLNALGDGPLPPQAVEIMKSLAPTDSPNKRIIITNPNLIGEATQAIGHGQIYPDAGQRLAALSEVYASHTVEVFIGLVNLGSFIPKALMSLPNSTRQDIIRSTDFSCLSWMSMVENIRNLAPNVQITLWPNEDAPLLWGDIVRNLGGLNHATPLADEFSLLSSLISPEGQQRVLELTQQAHPLDRASLIEQLAGIFAQHAVPEEIEEEVDLPGWSTDIVDAFTELYAQDLARLSSTPGVRLLRR